MDEFVDFVPTQIHLLFMDKFLDLPPTQIHLWNEKPIGKYEDFSPRGGCANQPYDTAGSLVFAPLEFRRPKMKELVTEVARTNKPDITTSNDRDVESSRHGKNENYLRPRGVPSRGRCTSQPYDTARWLVSTPLEPRRPIMTSMVIEDARMTKPDITVSNDRDVEPSRCGKVAKYPIPSGAHSRGMSANQPYDTTSEPRRPIMTRMVSEDAKMIKQNITASNDRDVEPSRREKVAKYPIPSGEHSRGMSANQPNDTARWLVSAPSEPRRPIMTGMDTKDSRMIKPDITTFNDRDVEPSRRGEVVKYKGMCSNQPYDTAGWLVSSPSEPRRPIMNGMVTEDARMIKPDITASNDKDVEPSRGGKVVKYSKGALSNGRCTNQPYDTTRWHVSTPLEPRRPKMKGVVTEDTFYEMRRKETLDSIMEALVDRNSFIIGLYGSCDARKDTLLQRVSRRVNRDDLFDVVVMVTVTKKTKILMVTVTKKTKIKRIQEEIACALELELEMSSVAERAISLCERIKKKGKVLVILRDLHKGFDLGKIGIPFGTDHPSTKILLTVTSDTEEIPTNHMHTEKNFLV